MKKFIAAVLSAVMMFGGLNTAFAESFGAEYPDANILASGAWYESAYIEWESKDPGAVYTVSYRESGTETFKQIDKELIRNLGDNYYRADILGLKGNTEYDIKLSDAKGDIMQTTVEPEAYDRSGFAFDGTDNAPGAYNADGTVPDNALILYVTEENKGNVYKNKNIKSILSGLDSVNEKKPVILRIIGEVTPLSASDTSPGMWKNTCGVTIEGVGPDSGIVGWGIGSGKNTDTEFRNLVFRDYVEDAIGFQNAQKLWIHNNDFYSGYNPKDSSGERDKLHGDGSCDLRECDTVTVSYNHFIGADKTSLIGSSSTSRETTGNITFHHNFFDGTNQRTPRVRWHNIHIYNNYYYNTGAYGVGCTCNASIFAENNYFEDAASPFLTSSQGGYASKFSSNPGGVIKAFNNKMVNTRESVEGVDYFNAPSREYRLTAEDYTTVSGGFTYNNFDAQGYIAEGNYILESPEAARKNVFENAGAIKKAAIKVTDISAPKAQGNTTGVYYYDADESGSLSAFGGKDGTGDYFKGNITCKKNTASGYRGTQPYKYSGSFSGSGAITFTTASEARLTIIAGSAATAPVRMEVTNAADPTAVYHGTFQTGCKGDDVLTQIELLSAGTYTLTPVSNADIYYIEVEELDGTYIERKLPDNGEPEPEPEPEIKNYGDADLSGGIEAKDAALILQYVLNPTAVDADEEFEKRCDVNLKNGVDANDSACVLQKTLNGSYMMPVEEISEK